MTHTRHFPELWCTVIAEPKDFHVEYRVYSMMSADATEWLARDYVHSGDTTNQLEDAAVVIHGTVKWDGCSDWTIEPFHGCERSHLENFGTVLTRCWDWTSSLCENWMDL